MTDNTDINRKLAVTLKNFFPVKHAIIVENKAYIPPKNDGSKI